jgi:hypothetical protein
MSRQTALAALAALLSTAAVAAPPNACELVTPEEINAIAERKVERVVPRKAGNPSECAFLDGRRGAVLVLSVREVKYAVLHELNIERDNLEKIYKARAKQVDTVGDAAYWLAPNKQFGFRKGKNIVNVTFSTPKNQNELDTAQIARLVESRIPK